MQAIHQTPCIHHTTNGREGGSRLRGEATAANTPEKVDVVIALVIRQRLRAASRACRGCRRGEVAMLGTKLSLSSRGRMTLGVGIIFWFISHTLP
jgi:hypothetical protein